MDAIRQSGRDAHQIVAADAFNKVLFADQLIKSGVSPINYRFIPRRDE